MMKRDSLLEAYTLSRAKPGGLGGQKGGLEVHAAPSERKVKERMLGPKVDFV